MPVWTPSIAELVALTAEPEMLAVPVQAANTRADETNNAGSLFTTSYNVATIRG